MLTTDAPPAGRDAVRAYFDDDAASYLQAYDRANDARGEIFRQRRAQVLELLREPLGRVLDIGSGPGVFTPALLARGADCWVADLSPRMVAEARVALATHPAAERVHYEVADIEHLPFADGSFETTLCVGVLQYLDVVEQALREVARVTRPGGQVIVSVPNRRSPLNAMHRGVVSTLRAGRAGLRCLGIALQPRQERLTFREDIPNGSFTQAQITAAARGVGLEPEALRYHSLHFPFAIPGCRAPLRSWDRLANRLMQAGHGRRWGREIILRLVRAS